MNKTELLSSKCALVTGAARGNGAALARGLSDHGAKVVLVDVDASALADQLACLRSEGRDCASITLDVGDRKACRAAAETFAALHGDLDILVNNAGVRPRHAFDAADRDEHWDRAIRINLEGIRNTTLAWLDGLRRSRGSVINITSIAGFNASPGSIGYSTSKAGAQMLSKALACELAPEGIRVNAIAPGVIETDMTVPSRSEPVRRERLLARIPMARFGRPEDLVGAAVFLASDLSAYVTGCTIAVDGGYLAN
jgi:NAD(P)-dependent dehydrogenase (short-subunit alcohol dehydrogenase family)